MRPATQSSARDTLGAKFARQAMRGPGFDRLRLIAATIVVFHHASGNDVHGVQPDLLSEYSDDYTSFGRLAVAIFFVMSGFLVTPSLVRTGSVLDFTVRRVLRIMPALIVGVVLTIVIVGPLLTTLPIGDYFTRSGTWLYLKNITTLTVNGLPGVGFDGVPATVNGALWSIHFEVLAYAVLAGMSVAGILGNRAALFITVVLFYFGNVALHFSPTLAMAVPGRLLTFMDLFAYFISGVGLFTFRDVIPNSTLLMLVALVAWVVSIPLGLAWLIMPAASAYVIVWLGLAVWPGRWFRSDYSYGVYIFHSPVLLILALRVPALQALPWWITGIVALTAALMLAGLSWRFVERPSLRHKNRTISAANELLAWRPRA